MSGERWVRVVGGNGGVRQLVVQHVQKKWGSRCRANDALHAARDLVVTVAVAAAVAVAVGLAVVAHDANTEGGSGLDGLERL